MSKTKKAAPPPALGRGVFPHVVIRASAGSGKTFQLSNRFLALAYSSAPVDRILATTFARKAAGEIIDRILERLADAALDEKVLAQLAKHLELAEVDRARCLTVLRSLVDNLHRLRIGTLDRFFIQLAGAFSLELGLPPGWAIVEELDDEALRTEAVRLLLTDSSSDMRTLIHLLSKGEATRQVVEQIDDIVASLYDVYCETEASAWRGLPRPPRLSADELNEAIDQLAASSSFTSTSFAKTRAAAVDALQIADWEAFISKGLAEKIAGGETTFARQPITPDICDLYKPLIAHARAVLLGQLASQNEATHGLLARFDEIFSRLKFAQGSMRFSDVTLALARGFRAGHVADIAYRMDGQIEHLLVDEFQDTSLAQFQVLFPFALRCAEEAGRSFLCVGDVKQAIYGWRGGVAEVFDAVEELLPGLTQRALDESYRSSPVVIEAVNRMFSGLLGNAALDTMTAVAAKWGQRFHQHRTAKTELAGHVRLITAPASGDGEVDVMAFAADEIRRLSDAHPGRSIGVLVRKNSAGAELIYRLRRLEVPASEEGGNPLTDSPAVQLVVSLLTLADHPGDRAARFHVATSALAQCAPLSDHDNDKAAARLSQAIREALIADGYGRVIYGWVKVLAPQCDPRDLNRLLQLVELAYGYEERATMRVDDFIQFISRRRVEDPTAAKVRVMTIHQSKGLEFDIVVLPELDVALKGQTPTVVVGRPRPIDPIDRVCRYVNKETQALLPPEFQRLFAEWPQRVVNESLCLLYVAMTRAVHALHMIIPPAKANEKTQPKTFAGLVRSSLAGGVAAEPGKTLFELGDPAWRAPAETGIVAGVVITPEVAEAIAIRLAPAPKNGRRSLERRSPASLQGGVQVDLKQRLEAGAAAKARGILVHAWLAEMDWIDSGNWTAANRERLLEIARPLATAETRVDAELKRFERELTQPGLKAALSPEGHHDSARDPFSEDARRRLAEGKIELTVYREWPFAMFDSGALVEGRIDRLVVLGRNGTPVAAEVIDYKTDRLTGEGAAARHAVYYKPQMEAYRRAVSQIMGLDARNVACRLLFLDGGVEQLVDWGGERVSSGAH